MLSLTLFKIISVTIPSPSSGFSLWEDQDVPLKEGTGGTPCKPRRLNFPLCWILPPIKNWNSPCLLTWDHISGKKKVSLIAFRQNFNKNFGCSVHFQLHNHDLFVSSSVNYLNYTPGISLLTKNNPLLWCCFAAPTRFELPPPPHLPLNPFKKPWRWEKILPNSQKLTHFLHQKNPPLIDLHLPLSTVPFLPHQIAIFM